MDDKTLQEVADQASKALGDASVASNEFVQKVGAESVSWVKKNQWAIGIFVAVLVVLVGVGLKIGGH